MFPVPRPTIANRQPTIANCQPTTTNRRQPPTAINCQPTAGRDGPKNGQKWVPDLWGGSNEPCWPVLTRFEPFWPISTQVLLGLETVMESNMGP